MKQFNVSLFAEHQITVEAENERQALNVAKDQLQDNVHLVRGCVSSPGKTPGLGLVVVNDFDPDGLQTNLRSAPIRPIKNSEKFSIEFNRNGRTVGKIDVAGDATSLTVILPQIAALWANGTVSFP